MRICSTREGKLIHFSFNQIHSQVLDILACTDDIHSRVLLIRLRDADDLFMGTEYPHEYCRYASRVLQICFMGTDDMPHGHL